MRRGFVATVTSLTGCGLTKAQKDGIGTFGQAAVTVGTASKGQLLAGREKLVTA